MPAQRFYLSSSMPAVVSPGDPFGVTYDHKQGSVIYRSLLTLPDGSPVLNVQIHFDPAADHLVTARSLHFRFVTQRLPAQTIAAQTVKIQMQVGEFGANANLFLYWILYVVDAAGAWKITLIDRSDDIEMALTMVNRKDSAAISQTTLADGDRLVLDVGSFGTPTANGGVDGHNCTHRFGCVASSGDLPEDDTEGGSTFRPWLEFGTGITVPVRTEGGLRMYLSDTVVPPVSPADPSGISYGHQESPVVYRGLVTAPDLSDLSTVAITFDAADHLVAARSLHRRYVSEPLHAQTLDEQMLFLQVQALEAVATNNLYLSWVLYLTDSGGAWKSTLVNKDDRAVDIGTGAVSGDELATALTGHADESLIPQTTIAEGDRLVLDLATTGTPAASAGVDGHNASFRFGCVASGGDLPRNDTETGLIYRPWLEFERSTGGGAMYHAHIAAQPEGSVVEQIKSKSGWNAPHRFRGGKAGDILVRDTSLPHGHRWEQRHLTQVARGVLLRSHPDADAPAKLLLHHADQFVMQDGEAIGPWDTFVLDAATVGAGGLDTGALQTGRWYEIRPIRKRDGTRALLGHLAPRAKLDASQLTANASQGLRSGTSYQRVGETFLPVTGGMPTIAAYASIKRIGSPTGLVWAELWAGVNPPVGFSVLGGTLLATSDKFPVNAWPTAGYVPAIFPFRTRPVLTAGQTYALTFAADYAISASHYLDLQYNTADAYGSGNLLTQDATSLRWSAFANDLVFGVWVEETSSLLLPTGYVQYGLAGYAKAKSATAWAKFVQLDRLWRHLEEQEEGLTTTAELLFGFGSGSAGPAPDIPLLALFDVGASAAGTRVRVGGVPVGFLGLESDTLVGGCAVALAVSPNDQPQAMADWVASEIGGAWSGVVSAGTGSVRCQAFQW